MFHRQLPVTLWPRLQEPGDRDRILCCCNPSPLPGNVSCLKLFLRSAVTVETDSRVICSATQYGFRVRRSYAPYRDIAFSSSLMGPGLPYLTMLLGSTGGLIEEAEDVVSSSTKDKGSIRLVCAALW